MSLAPGSTIGPYTIVSALGAGGMGEVYRATDTRLGREVAIKVLPDAVAGDTARLARFEREARALAALNHFNIAQVYGFEDRALIMELLEGETLRERLSRGALPIRKAIEFATQVARGLAAAHDRGIIHRDLKPENLFIVTDGHVKILDFGLARQDAHGQTETITAGHSTLPGTVMGTVGYMSPEQVRGLVVDARSDLFSLGAVLYEMLTGTRAFRRDSSADTMAAILNDHPRDVTAVRADVSAALDRIVQHCLEKNPVERFQSARDVAFALDSLSGSAASVGGMPSPALGWSRERMVWAAVTTVLALALAWFSIANRTPPFPPLPVSRALLVLPDGAAINELAPPGSRFALSPDGTRLVFEGRHGSDGTAQLFLLPLDGGAGVALPGTESGISPFWAPDGNQIMFSRDGNLMRMPLDGASPVPVTKGVGFNTPGTWGPNRVALVGGSILHAVQIHNGATSIIRDRANNARYDFPQFLPDGKGYVFGALASSGEVSISTGRIGSSNAEVLINGFDIGKGAYASGALLYTRGDTLFAQRAESSPLRLTGDPIRIASQVLNSSTRGGAFSVSTNGVIVYQAVRRENVRLTWLDRKGQALSTIGDDGDYTNVELSNDGRRALVSMTDTRFQTRDIFIVDLERGVRQRFTIDPSDERSAIWSPDSRQILYTSKGLNLYSRAADSSSDEQAMIVDGVSKDPYDWSSDGRWLLYRRSGVDTGNDIWIGPSDSSGPGRILVGTRFSEVPGNFSPDGRFLVYVSDESGQREVYVMKVGGGGKIQISVSGGFYPLWRGDGREIVYLTTDRTVMSAAVQQAGGNVTVSAPRPLFKINVGVTVGRMYDVTADGTRFLAAIPVPSRIPPVFTVITNWPRLLEKN